MMSVPIAEAIIGGRLGRTSKMPGYSWGISAEACQRGAELASNLASVCSHCYARRGRYVTPVVKAALERRRAALAHPQWGDAMAFLLNTQIGAGYFRWFDTGDLQSADHLRAILRVAIASPGVRHWIPTHEREFVREVLFERNNELPANVCIRASSDVVEEQGVSPFGLPTSTVHRWPGEPVPTSRGTFECAAYTRGEHCGSCRACWEPGVKNVSYLLNAGLRRKAAEQRGKRAKGLRLIRTW